jgi:hypothetical protein
MLRNLLVAGGLAATLAATIAAPASASSPPAGGARWAVSISPANVYIAPAHTGAQTFTVKDHGKTALAVTVRAAEVSNGTIAATPPWASVSPASFTLQPGQTRTVTLKVAEPARTRNDVAVIATARPPGAAGAVKISAAVGARVQFHPFPIGPNGHWRAAYFWAIVAAVALVLSGVIVHYVRRAHREAYHARHA